MDHAGKRRVAEEIGRRLGERFGDRILFGVLSGSVARGDDTERSDLEFVFVTRGKVRVPGMSPDGYREFLLGDLQTQFEFRTKSEVLGLLTHVGPYWPMQVWLYLEPHVIFGDPRTAERTVAEFRRRVAALPDHSFRTGAGHALLWARGQLGKVRNACEAGDDARAAQAAEWMGYDVARFVALANRRYYRHADSRWLEESRDFPLIPEGYRERMARLLLSRDREELLRTTGQLYDACVALAAEQGILMERFEDTDQLVHALDSPGPGR